MPTPPPQPARELVLFGGGGHALVVAEAASAAGFTIRGVYDDDPNCVAVNRLRLSHLGRLADIPLLDGSERGNAHPSYVFALGDLAARERLSATFPHGMNPLRATVIHPRAIVSPSAHVQAGGCFIGAGAVVQSFATFGFDGIVNTGAIVEHECDVGNNVHIAPGAVLAGRVAVGDHTLIGLGARVLPGLSIGASCTIGAGAVVTRDVPDGATVKGVPAA